MFGYKAQRCIHRAAITVRFFAVVTTVLCLTRLSRAGSEPLLPQQSPRGAEVRSGGVMEESFVYHRQAQAAPVARSVEPAGGWYGYGFPVSTFRWGWFGAAHYYPTVFWHDGYYGECCRFGYRRGY